MKELEILKVGAPVLREKAIDVSKITKEVYDLIKDMFFTMYCDEKGVGLAAPQVGEGIRIIVIDVTAKRESPMVFINPKISKKEGEDTQVEECLSVPGTKVPVKRATTVVVSFANERGNELKIQAQGLLARVIQHEIDHLDGKLILDYLEPTKIMDEADEKILEEAKKEKILP